MSNYINKGLVISNVTVTKTYKFMEKYNMIKH